MTYVTFGYCTCGGQLVPIWNTWIDTTRKSRIHGIDVLRCKDCYKDYLAPTDYDTYEDIY